MRPYSMGSINALVKWGGAAALKDTESQARIKKMVIDLRKKTSADLQAFGYDVIPSETNFFMVHIEREVGRSSRSSARGTWPSAGRSRR